MKVAIDARWIFREISGIDNCTRELLRHLPRLDRSIEYVALFCDEVVEERTVAFAGLDDAPNVRIRRLPYGVFSPFNQMFLGHQLQREGIDLYHSPNYMIPLLAFPRRRPGRVRCVMTLHDVIPLLFPDHAPRSRKSRLYPVYKGIMKEVTKRADGIIAVSGASRADIIRTLDIEERRHDCVRVIYNGVADRFCPLDEGRTLGEERVVLYVGRADPYKNLETLVYALDRIRESASFPIRLVVAGARDPRYPEASTRARELGIEDLITWTGYLSDEELVATYQQADVLAHPSRYEGFGLQVIEAMACGTPVVCSNRGALPEVAGDAAILVDPDDIAGLAGALTRVLTNPELAMKMSTKGLERAAGFTWQRTAEETLNFYREVLSMP